MTVFIEKVAYLDSTSTDFRVPTIGDESDAKLKRLPRVDRLALQVAKRVLLGHTDGDDIALVSGTDFGGVAATLDFLDGYAVRGPAFCSPTAFHESVHHALAGQISIQLKLRGPSLTISGRELSGEAALKVAVEMLNSGRVHRVLVVAAEETTKMQVAMLRSFKPSIQAIEGAAAVFLSNRQGPVRLQNIHLSSVAGHADIQGARKRTQSVDPLRLCSVDGLIRVAKTFEELCALPVGERTTRTLTSNALGGTSSSITLERIP